MNLLFKPHFVIDHDWKDLVESTRRIADYWIKSEEYRKHIMYEQGASVVARAPLNGWVSKSGPSKDFFVYGGILETEKIGKRFQERFPNLTFTPATICYTSANVPRHKDSIKNGLCSLIYPLHDHDSMSYVYENDRSELYGFEQYRPVIIDITKEHEVLNRGERIWFSIHFHQTLLEVKKSFDKLGKFVL